MKMGSLPCQFLPRFFGGCCLAVLLLPLWPVSESAGQTTTSPGATQPVTPGGYSRTQPGNEGPLAPDAMGASAAKRLEHMREEERRKRLLSDTSRLVELTNELKSEVDKTSKDELSIDVVRKAAEIEKLAHDVKERMKS